MSSSVFDQKKRQLLSLMKSLSDMFTELSEQEAQEYRPEMRPIHRLTATRLILTIFNISLDSGGDTDLARVCVEEFFLPPQCEHKKRSQEVLCSLSRSLLDLLDSMQSNVDELECIVGCIVRTIQSIADEA